MLSLFYLAHCSQDLKKNLFFLPPPVAKVKNVWQLTSTPPYISIVLYLINEARDNAKSRTLQRVHLCPFVETWLIRQYTEKGTHHANTKTLYKNIPTCFDLPVIFKGNI
jgi:hypothetical protein